MARLTETTLSSIELNSQNDHSLSLIPPEIQACVSHKIRKNANICGVKIFFSGIQFWCRLFRILVRCLFPIFRHSIEGLLSLSICRLLIIKDYYFYNNNYYYMYYLIRYVTTGSTLAFAAYSLAMCPEIQERLRDEIVHVLGKDVKNFIGIFPHYILNSENDNLWALERHALSASGGEGDFAHVPGGTKVNIFLQFYLSWWLFFTQKIYDTVFSRKISMHALTLRWHWKYKHWSLSLILNSKKFLFLSF